MQFFCGFCQVSYASSNMTKIMVNADLLLHIHRQSTLRQRLSSFASSRITSRIIISIIIWYTQFFGGFLKEGDAHVMSYIVGTSVDYSSK